MNTMQLSCFVEVAARAERRLKHKQRPSSQQLRIGVHDGLEAQLIASTLKRMNAEAEGFDPVIRMAPMSALRSRSRAPALHLPSKQASPPGRFRRCAMYSSRASPPSRSACA